MRGYLYVSACFVLLSISIVACNQESTLVRPEPPFLLDGSKNTTPTYDEGIAFWKEMADYYTEVELFEFGMTDAGYPLHVVVIGSQNWKTLDKANERSGNLLLINNAIHPGEPDGVDASMLLVHQLLEDNQSRLTLGNNTIAIIPFYNIGGALNRNSTTRANQNGPVEYGFRGNAQNLDLNRDFIKSDSKNAQTFAQLIHVLDPDLYIETHVSNGADYQYVITYLCAQEDKLGYVLGDVLRDSLTPHFQQHMTEVGFEMSPYVNVHGGPPDEGFTSFYDMPRYSTGYLSQLGIPAYITETHMLKPYESRVEATLQFLQSGVKALSIFNLKELKLQHREDVRAQTSFPIDWEVDHSKARAINFKGYEYTYKLSEINMSLRSFYDRSRPFEKPVPYYGWMKPTKHVESPTYYILQRGFVEVENRLRYNGIELIEYESDTLMDVTVYHIDTFSTSPTPYEKHYLHSNVRLIKSHQKVVIKKGDWKIPLSNSSKRFLVEVLEPEAPDSYFDWNFFDAVLQQKEWYSAYVFEDEAAELLHTDIAIKQRYDSMMTTTSFAENPQYQLYWIYQQSNRHEQSHMRYPVFRVE